MFADLYIINVRIILKTMQLLKLNALTLLLIINKRHKRHVIIENFKDQKFYYSRIIMTEDCDD